MRFDRQQCAMLRPLMVNFVAVKTLRQAECDELYNLPDWVVQPASRWVSLFEQLHSRDYVVFRYGSRQVCPSKSDLIERMSALQLSQKELKDKVEMQGRAPRKRRESLLVGFTTKGGALWEECTHVNWDELFFINVSGLDYTVTVEVCSDSAVDMFDTHRQWPGRLTEVDSIVLEALYWRTFTEARRIHYELTENEFEVFKQNVRYRGQYPICATWAWAAGH